MTAGISLWQDRCAKVLSCFYGLAGVLHILFPLPFLSIMPFWVPTPRLVIVLTGVCEIAGAIGILIEPFRRSAGIGLALYAVCVFPANIKHAMDALADGPSVWQWIYHLVRLPLQPVIVWMALFAGGLVTWPARKR